MRTHKLFISDGLIQLGAVIIILRHGNVRQAAMSRRARSAKGKKIVQCNFISLRILQQLPLFWVSIRDGWCIQLRLWLTVVHQANAICCVCIGICIGIRIVAGHHNYLVGVLQFHHALEAQQIISVLNWICM